MAKTPRTWTGTRTPSGLKRVRQAERRREVLQPRRSAAKTYVAKALTAAAAPAESNIDPVAALAEALSALDRAAKVGAIHPNAAARRKSRLTRKVNAALGGEQVQTGGRVVKTTGKAAAAEGRQGPHRRRQGRQGQGRPDRSRQGPRGTEQDGPGRGSCRQGRRRGRVRRDRSGQGDRHEDRDQGPGQGEGRRSEEGRNSPQGSAEGRSQARREGDREGSAEGQEGHDQGIARSGLRLDPATDDAPALPGRFDSGLRRRDAGLGGHGLGPEDPVEGRATDAAQRRQDR